MNTIKSNLIKVLLVGVFLVGGIMLLGKTHVQANGSSGTAFPYLKTMPANGIESDKATLNGVINLEKLTEMWDVPESQIKYWFQYSKLATAGGYGSKSTSTSSVIPGSNAAFKDITGLESSQVYYYRLCATDYAGHRACGTDVAWFITLPTCNENDTPWIRVVTPNGNEGYTEPNDIPVTWGSCNIKKTDEVKIALMYDDGTTHGDMYIIPTDNDGHESVMFNVPLSGIPITYGKFFRIRIWSDEFSAEDYSDDLFTVNQSETSPSACVDTGLPNRSYVIGQTDPTEPTTQEVMQDHPDALIGRFTLSAATGTVCGWEAIQLVSPSNPFPLLTSIRIVAYGGESLIDMPIDANTFQWNGSHYYAWFHFKDPVPVYEGDVKQINISGRIGSQSGFFTVGIGGINHHAPGAYVSGLPVFDKVILVRNQ